MRKYVVTRYTGLGSGDTEDILIEAEDFHITTSGALYFQRYEKVTTEDVGGDGEAFSYDSGYTVSAWADGEWLAVTLAVSAERDDGTPGVLKEATPLEY